MKNPGTRAPVWPYVLIYVTISLGLIFALVQLRDRVVSRFDPQRDAANWARWRNETETPDPHAMTSRRPVQSDTPPAYLLLRDHFAACVLGLWLTSSVPIAVTLWLLRAMIHSSTAPKAAAPKSSIDAW